jgi:ribonuclease D
MDVVDGDLPKSYLDAAVRETIVGVDIETSGLLVAKDTIACVQVYVPNMGTVMVRYINDIPVRLAQLLESYRVSKVFQFAQFDLSFLIRDYPFICPHAICDTKIAADILDPEHELFMHPVEHKASHSLIALIHHYYGEILDKETARTNWHEPVLSERQLAYAEKDVIYLPDLLRKLEREIFNKNPLLINDLHRAYRNITQTALARIKKAA